jgi:hypothetical protein
MMRWNWPNKPRYKGQKRPSDDGRFPTVGLGGGNRHELTQSGLYKRFCVDLPAESERGQLIELPIREPCDLCEGMAGREERWAIIDESEHILTVINPWQ